MTVLIVMKFMIFLIKLAGLFVLIINYDLSIHLAEIKVIDDQLIQNP